MMSSCRAIFKNNLAYTEDNVLIYNIFVCHLSETCTENMIRSYFTRFGEVVGVHKKLATASVHFKDACSAYKALVHSRHQLLGTRIHVEAGYSWKQPDADKVLGRTGRNNGDSEEKNEQQDAPNTSSEPPSNALTLLSLNDDCLEIICGVLELRDQVNFARVCQRLNDVFKMFSKHKYKKCDLFDISKMTLWEIRDFLRFSSEYVEDVTIDIDFHMVISDDTHRKRIIEFIRLFCKNLKRIELWQIGLQPDAFTKLLRSFPKLVELRLIDCNLNDTTVQSLLHLKNLTTLVIFEDDVITGKFFSGLSQLKKLSLTNCRKIEEKNLIKICESMKNLKSLKVGNCNVTSHFVETMADHCLELEVLKMSCPLFSFDCVARLPSLKHLELWDIGKFESTLPTTLLTELVAHKADQLESLICTGLLTVDHFTAISELKQLKQLKMFYCDIEDLRDDDLLKLSKLQLLEELVIKKACDITNEALLRLLQNCTRLHLLDIESCKKISTQFIAEAIDILKKGKEKSIKPLTIYASDTSINECALENFVPKGPMDFGRPLNLNKFLVDEIWYLSELYIWDIVYLI